MFDLTGKNALVTGASGGIGRAIAIALSAQGASVGLSGTRENVLNAVFAELITKGVVLPCNLSDPDDVDGLVSRTEEALGSVDILVANAGINRDGLVMRMKDEDWESVINVNLGSYFRLVRTSLRGMMKQRNGRIIGVTSVVGSTGNPGQANYCASKSGMIGFTKSVALEVATRGITANCVAPGFIETPMTEALTDKQKEALKQRIPVGRAGQSDEIAAAVLYLASDEAAYVTGQTVHVNGGMAML